MIEKAKVKEMLKEYENKLQTEINEIKNEMEEMRTACNNFDLVQVWLSSTQHNVMREKVLLLTNILCEVCEMRDSEMLEEKHSFDGQTIICPECGEAIEIEFNTARCETCGWMCADAELDEIIEA